MYAIDLSLTNGLGKPAVSVYFSGCDKQIKCEGCHNSELWKEKETILDYSDLYNDILMLHDINAMEQLQVVFLGGDPFTKKNRKQVIEYAKNLKEDFTNIIIGVYTYREVDEIEDAWVENIDYGVLGPFDLTLLDTDYLPASSNQYIYDFNNKRKLERIKLKEE